MSSELPPNRRVGPVSAVVVNYEGERYLPACLDALAAADEVTVAEVIVVDNASTDRSLALLAADYPHVRVVRMGENAGPAKARNAGMRAARHPWVLALDNDAVVTPGMLAGLCAAAEARPDAAILQPRSVFADDPDRVHYDGGELHYAGLFALRNFYVPRERAVGEGVCEVGGAVSVCLLVDRDALLEIGGYDERYFILFEDLDLSFRLRARGHAIVSVEDAIVRHDAGTAGISFRRGTDYPASRVFYHSRNRWLYLAKCYRGRTLLLAAPGLVVYELVGFFFAVLQGGLGAWVRGKWAVVDDWRETARRRRTFQRSRTRGDGALLVGGPLTLTPGLRAGRFSGWGARGLDAVLRGVWACVRRFAGSTEPCRAKRSGAAGSTEPGTIPPRPCPALPGPAKPGRAVVGSCLAPYYRAPYYRLARHFSPGPRWEDAWLRTPQLHSAPLVRILLVTHRFPPRHRAGTELYTAELATRLAAAGDEVHVACAEKDVARPDLTWHEREHAGLPVHELVQNLLHDDFRETWEHPRVTARFDELLEQLRPDVVHVQHLLYLGVGVVERARARGAATCMTCHDFWFECPRLGQLVHADGALCERVDFGRCGTCLPSYAWRQPPGAVGAARAVAGLRRVTGVNLAPLAERVARRLRPRTHAGSWSPPDAEEAARFATAARTRDAELRTRLGTAVQRFFSPSRFLRDRLVAWGMPADRVEHVATGVDRAAFARPAPRPARDPGAPLEVLFLGSLVPLKGAHVLIEAWGRLAPEVRERARLRLHGPAEHAPRYAAELLEDARASGATVGGALGREDVASALARADLVVVPSLWFENRPLVILEAFCAGTPVVVSDLGGAAELVEEGATGWRFPAGDAARLAELLDRLLRDPALIPRDVATDAALLPDWSALVRRMRDVYGELLEGDDRAVVR